MSSPTTRALNRRALIIHPLAALTLATVVAALATLPRHWQAPLTAIQTAPLGPWDIAAAVLVVLAVAVGIVMGGRRAAK